MLKVQDILDIGPSELVNRLIIITHHAKIAVFGSQEAYQLKLGRIGILILIYHDITKPFLIIFQYIRVISETVLLSYTIRSSKSRALFCLQLPSDIPYK